VHEDDRLLLLERHVRDPVAVGRPGRRDDRLAIGQDEVGIAAVGIGHLQLVAFVVLHHVADARCEHAGLAGEFLVDDVGDLVRRDAHLARRDREAETRPLRLLDRVHQPEAHREAAVGTFHHVPDHQVLDAAVAHVAPVHLFRFARELRHPARALVAEQAAAQQVGKHDLAHLVLLALLVAERQHRDGDLLAAAADDLDGQGGADGCRSSEDGGTGPLQQGASGGSALR
jgi:hypothetical protein